MPFFTLTRRICSLPNMVLSVKFFSFIKTVSQESRLKLSFFQRPQCKYCHSLVSQGRLEDSKENEVQKRDELILVDRSEKSLKAHIKDILIKGSRHDMLEESIGTSAASPSFNFAAYVNDSPMLQQLVKLGVNLYELERKKGVAEFILRLNLQKDIAPYIRFLHDVGVPADSLGAYFTKNPWIFKESLDDLQVRINYLESKQFTADMIARIVSVNPFVLNFRVQFIDAQLGHYQKTFHLNGSNVRYLATKQPKLITYDLRHIRVSTFIMKEEVGFTREEMKLLLLAKPRLWMMNHFSIKNRFEYAHLEMKLSHEFIRKNPEVLLTRLFRVKERHLFLKSLNRAQYDPCTEGYVSMKQLVSGSDAEFCGNVAKASLDTFNMFLKTL